MDDYVGTGTQSQDYDAMSVGREDGVPSTPGSKMHDDNPSLAIAASGEVLNDDGAPPSAQKSQRKSYTVAPFWSYLEMAYKLRNDIEKLPKVIKTALEEKGETHVFLKVTDGGATWKAKKPERKSNCMCLADIGYGLDNWILYDTNVLGFENQEANDVDEERKQQLLLARKQDDNKNKLLESLKANKICDVLHEWLVSYYDETVIPVIGSSKILLYSAKGWDDNDSKTDEDEDEDEDEEDFVKFPEAGSIKLLVQLLTDLGTWQPTKEMVNTQMNAYITAFKGTQTNDDSGVKKPRVMEQQLQNEAIGTKRRMQPEKEGEVDPKSIVRKDLLKFSKKQNNTFTCLWFMLSAYDPTLDEFFEPQVDGMSWAEMLLVEQILRKPTGEYRGQMMRIHEFDAVWSHREKHHGHSLFNYSPFLSDFLHEKVYEEALDTYDFIENQFATLFELTEENQKKKCH
jgi:hypothetical protein